MKISIGSGSNRRAPAVSVALATAIVGYLAITSVGGVPAVAAATASRTATASDGSTSSVSATATATHSTATSASSTATSASSTASATTSAPAQPSSTAPRHLAATQNTTAPAASGAQYLVRQLVDGDHLESPFGPDYGLTTDLALALAASGGQDGTLAKVVGYLRAHVADYADPAGTSSFPGPYSGAVGKLALLAEATGQNPQAFGGFDLLATLTGHVCSAADTAGSCTAPGDFYQSYSTVSQSLAVLALARGGVTPPAAAVSRLGQLQCADGGFSSVLLASGAACSSDVDTTSYALQALSLVPGASASVTAATSYLAGTQQADGGFSGAAGENANSTGLAAQGLLGSGAPGLASAVASAQAFLRGLQNSDGGFGIRATRPASDVRSTTQAVPALAGATLTTLLDRIVPVTPAPPSSTPPSRTPSRTPSRPAPASPTAGSASGLGAGSTSRPGSVLAATGASTSRPLGLAILLLLAGGALLGLTRLPRRRH